MSLDVRDPEDKLDLQGPRNSTFSSQLQSLTLSFQRFGLDLERVKHDQANVSSHVHSLESEASRVKTRVEGLESQVAPMVTQHINTTEQLSGLHGQVTNLNAFFQQLESKVQQQHVEGTNLAEQVHILSSANDQLKQQQTNLNSLEQSLGERLQSLASDVQRNHNDVSALSQENSQVAGKVEAIVQQVQKVTSWMPNATALMAKLEKQAAVLTLEGAGVKEELDNLTVKMAAAYQNLQLLGAAQHNDTLLIQALEGVTSNLSMANTDHSCADDELSVKLQNLTDTLQRARELQDAIRRPASCDDVKQYDLLNGLHTLYLAGNTVIPVYCDQTTDQGGWTVIQRRQDGSVDFYRKWEDYQKGFGDLTANFWLGLSNIHLMTSQRECSLRIDMRDFHGNTSYAKYNIFHVADEKDSYRLHVDQFSGNAGDSLEVPVTGDNSMAFSTFDRDNDIYRSNCADESLYAGGWWYARCGQANLNGIYKYSAGVGVKGIFWYTWTNTTAYLSHVEMKIKCQST
ncbi:angiopoietin-related protein 7-like [Pomacea canaliculata]|uniref:angiopoietin-related protein 7-like n=1 Tax=Pomacea canaliculata TaxID=400727 RepID=UPI000D733FD7|nr:angiopoietin-related protein 7-like [Pomacea canaliculata]